MEETLTPVDPSLSRAVGRVLRSPVTWIATAVWIAANAFAYWLADGFLPFDQPALSALPFNARMAFPTIGVLQIFILMAIAL